MRVLWITLVAVLLDQIIKLTVVSKMYLGESIPVVGDWLKWTYTTNPGMAFGVTLGPPFVVTAFAVFATVLIVLYLRYIRGAYTPYRASLALILGGALGNIIDRVAYGVFFGAGGWFESFARSPFPAPAQWFRGQVVDFVHVDIGIVNLPLLGERALFPIWNVADMCIVFGVIGFIVFQTKFQLMFEQAIKARVPVAATDLSTSPAATPQG
ncbi:MAG: signal peptidase II [Rhodothermales bacterium]|nr:signal peptidase II [Rhodothermales bacterium]